MSEETEFDPKEFFKELYSEAEKTHKNNFLNEIKYRFDKEIKELKREKSNEHLWELGYNGELEFNPHTMNIERMDREIAFFEKLREKVNEVILKVMEEDSNV